MSDARTATVTRVTAETRITLTLNLDGGGTADVQTGVGFFDHMLTHLARHGLFDLTIRCDGDLHIDAHHTVEDVGIAFGQALTQCVGTKAGVRRYGDATLPMDDALVTAAVDLSGRPFLVWRVEVANEMLGNFSSPLAEEFWRAVSSSGVLNLHVIRHHGHNAHHVIECTFKAVARALRMAVERDPRQAGRAEHQGEPVNFLAHLHLSPDDAQVQLGNGLGGPGQGAGRGQAAGRRTGRGASTPPH